MRERRRGARARNLYAKLPAKRERVKQAYWRALDDAISEHDAKQRLKVLVDELDKDGFAPAAKCLADDLDALVVHLRYHPDTAADGATPTCSSAHWARSSAAPK